MKALQRNQPARKKRCLMACTVATMLVLLFGSNPVQAEERIFLRPEMLLNESGIGDASKLVDEQESIGDPAKGKGLRPEHPFFPGWTTWLYPIHLLVDLGTLRPITRLYLYNETGESSLTLSTGTPFIWKSQEITLNGYRTWREFPLNTTTRYLRLTLSHPISLPEMALYGERQELSPGLAHRVTHPRPQPTMDQFIGTNAFIDDPVERLAIPVGFVREYHNWSWDNESSDRQLRFEPSGAAGGNAWFFDDYYAHLHGSGILVSPAIQQSSPAYFPGNESDAKPVPAGKDPEDPASYALHAAHLFQYAARYGSTHVPDALLQLAPDQPRRSGLDTLHYLENWNEPDKTWRGRAGHFTPYELAAMCSADYDGHQGRLGKRVGIHNASPQMRLVVGGLAGLHLDYLRAMKLWADVYRGGDFPADVLNLHYYSSDGDEQQAFKTTGISPEADHVREKLAAFVAWRDANLPDRELWVTEFGYDTNPKSPLHAPAIGSYSALEVQGSWLVRSYLALAAAGVDRAAMYMFRDVKSDGAGVFETSGMVTEKGQWNPKPAYYYIATLKKRLAGMRFAGEVASNKKDVLIYRFTGAKGNSAYAIWCSTSEDRHIPEVTLSLNSKTATRVDFTNDSLQGKATPLSLREGRATLEAREKPLLLLVP